MPLIPVGIVLYKFTLFDVLTQGNIEDSIYSTYTGKGAGVILVTFALSYSPYLILPRTYTVCIGPIRFTLDYMEFTLDNMTPVFTSSTN